MSSRDSLTLGQSCYLIKGLNPDWSPSRQKLDILYPPEDKPLNQLLASATPGETGEWRYPEITLHDTAESMLDALIPYEVKNPSSSLHAEGLSVSALLKGGRDNDAAMRELGQTIGVDLLDPDLGYALVRLVREDTIDKHASASTGIFVHARPRKPDPEYGIKDAFHKDMVRLRHAGKALEQVQDDRISIREVDEYLDMFKHYGTHFVSSITLGDCIMQVFAYPRKRFERVKAAYASGTNPLSGPGSEDFVYFTTDHTQGDYGFVAQYGNILCMSNSGAFRTSLANGDWRDRLWAKHDSVFALFNENASFTLSTLQKTFTEQAQIAIELTTMTLFVEFKRSLLWQRFLKAAFVQKYGTAIRARFAIHDDRDFVAMIPEDQPGVLSTIATPKVNLYKSRLDIGDMQFVAADEVEDFTLFANVLTASANDVIEVPGKCVHLFAQILDMRTDDQPKRLELHDSAYDAFEIACDEFLGAMLLGNKAGSKQTLIVDGIRFGIDGDGRDAEPVAVADVRTPPPADALPELLDSMQYAMTFAEAVISDQRADPSDGIQRLVRDFLRWLARFIPSDTDDKELLTMRVRALDLSHYAMNPSYGSFVPILPYTDYEAYVEKIMDYTTAIQQQIINYQQQIRQRKQEELIIDVAKTLNHNIVETGELLTGMIDANVQQQRDLAGYYDSVLTKQQAEAKQQSAKVDELEGMLFKQQGEVDAAVQKYKAAVDQWRTMEAIKFGLDVATNLFSLGTTIAIPSTSIKAVAELGKTVQMIQKTLNVLNATWKLYSGVKTEVGKLVDAQKTLDELEGADFGSPSTLSWDEMSLQFKQIMATGPSGPEVAAAKAELDTAFNTLILRGKALTNAKSSLHGIQRDIYANQIQREINERQAKRLDELKEYLHPEDIKDLDREKIDLMGLTGNLLFVRSQMLTILSKAFLQQDQALQYAYLQKATPIISFSLLKFRSARVQQQQATLDAKSQLAQYQASKTTPIDFIIEGVNPQELTGGREYSFAIQLDAKEFHPYVDARVISIIAEVDGIESTDSGEYLVDLTFEGTPFRDRDTERNPLTFRTPWRQRTYQYKAKTNDPMFSDGGHSWSEGVSRITPFSNWRISLPDTKTNKGLKFSTSRINLRLSFVLEARIVDAHALMKARLGMLMARAPMLAAVGQLPSVNELVSQMHAQGACTNDWDVVFNMSLEQINNVLQTQYDELKSSTSYKNTIAVETRTKVVEGVWSIKKFDMEYGYPGLTFLTNNNGEAKLEMQILKGSMQNCIQNGDEEPKCDPAKGIDGETLTANVKIGKIRGTIKGENGEHDVLRVELDMTTGSFDISNIELSDEEKVEFNKAVKAYFVNNPVVFLINQLDLTQIPTLDALKPGNFYFKPLKTPSGREMLQLFIQTGSRSLLDYSQTFLNNIDEPIPQAEECSLMIRTGLVFGSVLPQSLNTSGWIMAGVDNGGHKAWSGKFTQASVTGDVDLSPLNHSVSNIGPTGSGSITDYSYYIPGGNTVRWSLSDMTLKSSGEGKLTLSGDKKNRMGYKQKACTTTIPCWSCKPRCRKSDMSTDVNVNVRASLPLDVGGQGRQQTVEIATTAQSVDVTGHLSGGGPSGSDNLEAQVNRQIRSQVPRQIEGKLNVQFEPVSVFALKNLLFPSKNYIQFGGSYVPGDLLLVGTFTSGD